MCLSSIKKTVASEEDQHRQHHAPTEAQVGCLCRMQELQRQISSLHRMITTSSLSSLPDGGAKLRSRLAGLHQELASLGGTGRTQTMFATVCALLLSLHTAQLHVAAVLVGAQESALFLCWQTSCLGSLCKQVLASRQSSRCHA